MQELNRLLEKLSANQHVAGIALIGSTGNNDLHPGSDYDLLVVLEDPPVPLRTGVTWLDNRLTDLVFSTTKVIESLLADDQGAEPLDDLTNSIEPWLASAKIVHDSSGQLNKLKEQTNRSVTSPNNSSESLRSQQLRRLDKASYNLAQTRRTADVDDDIYQQAVGLRMLYQLSDLMVDYFAVRGMRWTGEKEAIRFWQANDPAYWSLFTECLENSDPRTRTKLYEQLIGLTMTPAGKPWREGTTTFTLGIAGNLTETHLVEAKRFWDGITR